MTWYISLNFLRLQSRVRGIAASGLATALLFLVNLHSEVDFGVGHFFSLPSPLKRGRYVTAQSKGEEGL